MIDRPRLRVDQAVRIPAMARIIVFEAQEHLTSNLTSSFSVSLGMIFSLSSSFIENFTWAAIRSWKRLWKGNGGLSALLVRTAITLVMSKMGVRRRWAVVSPRALASLQMMNLVFSVFSSVQYLEPKRTVIGQFEPKSSKTDRFGQLGPQSTKTDRDWPVWGRNYRNGPWLANLGSNLPKRTVIGQFGPKSTKTNRD